MQVFLPFTTLSHPQGFQKYFSERANLGTQKRHFWRHPKPKVCCKIATFPPNLALKSPLFAKFPPKIATFCQFQADTLNIDQ